MAFRQFIWPRRKHVLLGLILIVISRAAGLVLPGSTKYLMDDVVANHDMGMLKILLIAVVAALIVQSATSYALTQLLSVEAQRLISELRTKVQRKILSLPIGFFDNTKSGALVSRIMSDVEGVRNLVGTGLVQLVGGTLTAVASLIWLIHISPWMTLFTLVPVSIFAFLAMKAFARIRPVFRTRGVINAEVTGRLTETLNGVRVIKGFGAEEQENKAFELGVQRLFENVKTSLTATSFISSMSTFLLGLASAGIMGIGATMMVHDQLTTGEFLQFTVLLGFMIAPIVQMSNIGSQFTEAFAGLDRTEEIMNMEPEDDMNQRPVELEELHGDIAFNNVTFAYEEDKPVLHGVSFTAQRGSVIALVGTSGSGKSTIASLAASFLTPTSGTVTIDGHDLSTVRLASFRKHLGVVLQDDFLFEGTIRENILFPRPNATEEQIQKAVEGAYVHEFTDRFELGLDTVIGERGVKLSGGQRQRVAIARAMLADPRILILDEATSNLDTESEALIQKSLNELVKDRTTFVIAHRLSTIRQATEILVIEHGLIAERGTHNELIAKEGRYFDLYTYQARI
ncbi:MAG: ABC transporter ATP-binding protein [Flavobacteriales bacterium]|nr:ABC transporter ATP-binding protein [Flavobacteriales bacterium]MBK6548983.1 ABC transporter ATP-binding protein [Flavobacteriales bacterium]MBK6884423.1 ABC transporter ATP-binding protein [Flavobacteriales bacterium]MBK7100820.1 ABC transporter ATP-binding protein [Flavobacteriales bacterium]MBK7111507.1 ABC transporter ATP-binding protein [Flavobacteriales bacterium]